MMQRRFKLIYIVALVLLFYSIASLSVSYTDYLNLQAKKAQLCQTVDSLRDENARLRSQIAELDSGEAMETLARQRLGFVKPNEKIFYFISTDTERTDTENG